MDTNFTRCFAKHQIKNFCREYRGEAGREKEAFVIPRPDFAHDRDETPSRFELRFQANDLGSQMAAGSSA